MSNEASNTSASSSADLVAADIIRLIAPSDRPGFHMMLNNALRGRELAEDEMRRIAERTWKQFCFHGWTRA